MTTRYDKNCRRIGKFIKTKAEKKISKHFAQHKFSTAFTMIELCHALDLNTSTAHRALLSLHGKGVIKHKHSKYGGRTTNANGAIVPYEFTCMGCIAHLYMD